MEVGFIMLCFVPHVEMNLRYCRASGALWGPPVTKWLQFLNRLTFASKTKAVIYRVRVYPCCHSSAGV